MPLRKNFENTATVGFIVLAVVLALGMAFSIRRFEVEANTQIAQLRAEESEITLVERLRWNAELIVSDGRGYLLSGDVPLLRRLQGAKRRFLQTTDALQTQSLTAAGRGLASDAGRAARDFIRVQDELLDARRRSADSSAVVRRFESELVPLRLQLDRALSELVLHKQSILARSYEQARQDRAALSVQLYGLLAVLLLAGLGIGRYFVTRLSRSFRHEQDALIAAKRALAARDDLMGIVAHDLRNPLGAITMKATLIREVAQSDPVREQAQSIENIAKRMAHLIKTTLDVTTIEAGKFSVNPTRCTVEDLLRQTLDMFGAAAAAKQVELDQTVFDRGLAVSADRERVLQVLSNLVGNALKFTPNGGRVTLAVQQHGSAVQFTVADTGSGISAEHLPRIFDRFWREERSGQKGTGLGLFIANGIVGAHGGQIWAESDVGRGTRFHFTLPLAPSEAQEPHPTARALPPHPA